MNTGVESSRQRHTDEEPRGVVQWFYASPITLALAVILLVAIVGATAVVLIGSGDDNAPDSAITLTPPTTSLPATGEQAPTDDAFDSPRADLWGRKIFVPRNPNGQLLEQISVRQRTQALPPPAPQGVMWQSIYGFALPFTTSDGPTRWDGDIATGFSRRPEGSALAGWQLMFRQLGPKPVQEQIAQSYLDLDSTERAQFAEQLAHRPERAMTEVGPTVTAPDAFRLTSYDPGFAVVEYAVRDRRAIPNTQWAVTRAELVWDDGVDSWKLKGYSPQMLDQRIASIEGWTQW